MDSKFVLQGLIRFIVVLAGTLVLSLIVYGLGKWLIPYVTPTDYVLLAWLNPDQYTPGLDQFMRATTDYGNLIVALPLISWIVGYLFYLAFPRRKNIITGFMVAFFLFVLFISYDGPFELLNSVYLGANIMLFAYWFIAFGVIITIFYRMTRPQMRGFACIFLMVLIGSLLTDLGATNILKEKVARPRPFNEFHQPWNETIRHIPEKDPKGANSYPSGHTSGTFALLTPFFWYARRKSLRAGILAWCVLQGVTRVYTAAHFPSDVIMGGLLGFGIGTMVFFALGGPWLRARAAEDDVSIVDGAPLENAYSDSGTAR